MDLDWNTELLDQLESHWQNQLRPRLDGLTDDEYFWEPVPDCWSIRRREESSAPIAAGTGDFVIEYEYPPPASEPLTTIAWRMAHVTVACFCMRNAAHFGGLPASYRTFEYAGSASAALEQLDDAHDRWAAGVRGLGVDGLARPCGPAEGEFAEASMAALVLHIHREVIHHGAEIALLRDLYKRREARNGL